MRMKIYTRTGDAGMTGIIGARARKDDERIEAYGTIDELNAFVGQAASAMDSAVFADLRENLLEIQHELFDCGSDLAYAEPGRQPYKVNAEMVERLEQWIDRYEKETPPLRRFILPGGSMESSLLHVCRTVCRRAERRVVTLASKAEVNGEVLRYLNRLSDFFFVAARAANARRQVPDTEYIRSAEVFRRNE